MDTGNRNSDFSLGFAAHSYGQWVDIRGAAVIGIFVAAVYMWITIGVGWPSFLVITGLCFVAGTFTGVEIFANSSVPS
jgi:hypothetical protein